MLFSENNDILTPENGVEKNRITAYWKDDDTGLPLHEEDVPESPGLGSNDEMSIQQPSIGDSRLLSRVKRW
jgi:hypothetical protein